MDKEKLIPQVQQPSKKVASKGDSKVDKAKEAPKKEAPKTEVKKK